ncbi:hypothetical protein HPP92_004715 [Vanilla planifolia]|uniref:Uncharacterized protein n=1 Tax=Vanilla planifolia TaxID=51239 RepID=A0A835VEQ3_VANPL|nr:hypothetical protein HPP92_004715 [Vanilla planifolia]
MIALSYFSASNYLSVRRDGGDGIVYEKDKNRMSKNIQLSSDNKKLQSSLEACKRVEHEEYAFKYHEDLNFQGVVKR